jgi:hypothetical protein
MRKLARRHPTITKPVLEGASPACTNRVSFSAATACDVIVTRKVLSVALRARDNCLRKLAVRLGLDEVRCALE